MLLQMWYVVGTVMLLSRHITGEELLCYVCSYTSTAARIDEECVTDPNSVRTGDRIQKCVEGQVCQTVRVDRIAGLGIRSMSRSCSTEDPDADGCSAPYLGALGEEVKCTKQCNTNLCNGGENIESSEETQEESYEYYDEPVGFEPEHVQQDGWFKVWVSSRASALTLTLTLTLTWIVTSSLAICVTVYGVPGV